LGHGLDVLLRHRLRSISRPAQHSKRATTRGPGQPDQLPADALEDIAYVKSNFRPMDESLRDLVERAQP